MEDQSWIVVKRPDAITARRLASASSAAEYITATGRKVYARRLSPSIHQAVNATIVRGNIDSVVTIIQKSLC
jgi:hypothetical protein